MNEYLRSVQEFYKVYSNYIDKYISRSENDKNHGIMLQTAGEYYEMFQEVLQKDGSNEFLEKSCGMFLKFQDLVMEHKTEELKALHMEFGNFLTEEADKTAQQELFKDIFQIDIAQMRLQDEKISKCQEYAELDVKLHGEITEKTKEVLDVLHLEVVDGQVKEKLFEKQSDTANDFYNISDLDDFLKKHKIRIDNLKTNPLTMKQTLVVNAFGGPGAGKTTACLSAVSELNKRGYVAYYVQEYAKELVYDNPELLDGSKEHQLHILGEQVKRLDRFMGKADIIVTDASILFNSVYQKEPDKNYDQAVTSLHNHYKSFNFFVNRGEHYEQEGRMETKEESQVKDQEIKAMLDEKKIFYGNYNHQTVDKLANKIETTYKRLNSINLENREKGHDENAHGEGTRIRKPCQATAYLKKTTDKPTVLYGNNPQELLAKLQKWNETRPDDMKYYTCYVRTLEPKTNKYENSVKYDVATGRDITLTYLELPPMKTEDFLNTVAQLKADGAKFNPARKQFYITPEQDTGKFSKYLPEGGKTPHSDYSKDRAGKPSVMKKLEENKTKIEKDGQDRQAKQQEQILG